VESNPNFADRLISSIRAKGNPCVVGLDPRIDLMPVFIKSGRGELTREVVRSIIADFHKLVIDAVAELVPAVKPQLAFFEQYGSAGVQAFEDTVGYAKQRGMLVIADGKRNDISSTAEAYAIAFLGEADILGQKQKVFDADAATVTPYLGRDSLLPFVDGCTKYGKGIFVVLKTSNPGSRDFQDQLVAATGRPLYEWIAATVNDLGTALVGESGYSSIGAVIGATFPEDGRKLRALMPHALILVPGYGAQGGSAESAAASFNDDGLGAVVSSSRGITYKYSDPDLPCRSYVAVVRENTLRMIDEITTAVKRVAVP
jgi:orotidine-5'-phosphate decarboxylase